MGLKQEIIKGNFTYYLIERNDRKGKHPDPNFEGTGLALSRIRKNRRKRTKEEN